MLELWEFGFPKYDLRLKMNGHGNWYNSITVESEEYFHVLFDRVI